MKSRLKPLSCLFYSILSLLLLLLVIYLPLECLLPKPLHLLRIPISFARDINHDYHFIVPQKANYCLFIEKDRAFPLQTREYSEQPFVSLENISLTWEIKNPPDVVHKGNSDQHTFEESINAKEVARKLDCFTADKGNYQLKLALRNENTTDLWLYRIIIDEDLGNQSHIIRSISYSLRMTLTVILSISTSLLFLLFFIKLDKWLVIKPKPPPKR